MAQTPKGKKPGPLQSYGKVDKGPENLPLPRDSDEQYNFLRHSDAVSQISSRLLNEERLPDASSEKELGNEYFKQKKYLKAIECYSRSIALSPTAVAFANRAMAYIKVKRFEEAENDCMEALNLDDRYAKAYSRRATARKELGKLKAAVEDCEFVVRLELNNQDVRKQYTETKALYEKELAMKKSGASKSSIQGIQSVGNSEMRTKDLKGVPAVSAQRETSTTVQAIQVENGGKISGQPRIAIEDVSNRVTGRSHEAATKYHGVEHKHELKASMQDIASRAASRVMPMTSKNMIPPKSAYELDLSWRALSDDSTMQANLLKTIPPTSLPGIFKNALSAPMLVDIVRCTVKIFNEDAELAVSILDNLAKVPRFDMIVMCLSSVDRSELRRIWEMFSSGDNTRGDHAEVISRLGPKYLCGV